MSWLDCYAVYAVLLFRLIRLVLLTAKKNIHQESLSQQPNRTELYYFIMDYSFTCRIYRCVLPAREDFYPITNCCESTFWYSL